ncbi:MAG: pyrimidine dimer DNA glycosylase/endonuclease V [Chloroflexota bacterium]|nr:pyrimidine dimer DNA glycosylase/endonuclease V [Chloroflexota bacterium]
MRIWDLPPTTLCRPHLLGEHREIHALWRVLITGTRGYAHHPETRRWRGKLQALYRRHEALASEMRRRGYRHESALNPALATGSAIQDEYVSTPDEQRSNLRVKGCACVV